MYKSVPPLGIRQACHIIVHPYTVHFILCLFSYIQIPLQELYTGSNDCQIIAWAASRRANEDDDAEDGDNEDTWSD